MNILLDNIKHTKRIIGLQQCHKHTTNNRLPDWAHNMACSLIAVDSISITSNGYTTALTE